MKVSAGGPRCGDLPVLRQPHHDHHHPQLHRPGRRGPCGGEESSEQDPDLLWLHFYHDLRCGNDIEGWWKLETSLEIDLSSWDLCNSSPLSDHRPGRCPPPRKLLQGLLEHPGRHRGLLRPGGLHVHVSLHLVSHSVSADVSLITGGVPLVRTSAPSSPSECWEFSDLSRLSREFPNWRRSSTAWSTHWKMSSTSWSSTFYSKY